MGELISVIIPNYNRQDLIIRAVNSVLSQTYKNLEIIIVDDNSTDDSEKIIRQLQEKDSRIQSFFLPKNMGANYCRNYGVRKSGGEYISFLDSDDEFISNKLNIQYNAYKIYKQKYNTEIIFSGYQTNINNNQFKKTDRIITINDLLFRNMLGGFSTIFISKKAFWEVRGLDDSLQSCQDWDLYLKILEKYNGYYLSQNLVNYYIESDSISKNYKKVLQGHEAIFKKINTINSVHKLIDNTLLVHEQFILMGDIYRRFNHFDLARVHYLKGINKKITIRSLRKLLTVSLGNKTYKFISKLRK